MTSTTTTLFSQRATPRRCGFGIFQKRRIRRGTTRISRVRCDKARRGYDSRVPPSPGAVARRTRGVLVEGATPRFLALVRHRGGVSGPPFGPPLTPPLGGVAPYTVIPAGRPSSRLRSRQRKTADHKWPSGRERQAWGCTQPDSSDPQHGQLATPLDGLGLRVDTRLTCPPTSWIVQWIPVRLEGFNEGMEAG